MALIDLKYCRRDTDRHGNVRYHVRRGGRAIRIRGEPGSPEFMAAYHAAIAQTAPKADPEAKIAPGTLKWLGLQFRESAEFKTLDAISQRLKWNCLLACFDEPLAPGSEALMGQCPLSAFGPQHVKVLRDRKADKPGAAKNRLKHLGTLFSWAVENGKAKVNPVRDVKPLRYASDGFHTWTPDEVRQFTERHPLGSKAFLAIALLYMAGPRRQDVVHFGRQHLRGGVLRYVPKKTLKRKVEPVTFAVPPIFADILAASPTGDLTFLQTEYGRPFTPKGFSNWFKDRCREAGLGHCSPHGLRKGLATAAADGGATESQLMAFFGWSDPKMAARYTKRANRRVLADATAGVVLEAQRVALFGDERHTAFGGGDTPSSK